MGGSPLPNSLYTHPPPPPTVIFLGGIKGLAVPQQNPVAQQTLQSQGHWIYAQAQWTGEYDYLICENG